jgi:hypothetical protein
MEHAMPGKKLAEAIAANETLRVNCGHPACQRSTQIDVQALAVRLGSGHGAMHDDLVGYFRCEACKAAGRPRRAVYFTVIPDYDGINARRQVAEYKPIFTRGQ